MNRPLLFLLAMLPTFASAADATKASDATNALGITLLNTITPADNALLSPFSIQIALVMTYAGAAGETRKQMADTLGFGPDAVADFAALATAVGTQIEDEKLTLLVANALFGQKGYPFVPDFLEALKANFAAPLQELDFQSNPGAATTFINDWVSRKTRTRIENLIPGGALTRDTSLVLANALYFKSPWLEPFQPEGTSPRPFHLPDGTTRDIPMMRLTTRFGYLKGNGFASVALPYANPDFALVILLPDASLADFEKSVSAGDLKAAAGAESQRVALTLPKFGIAPPVMALGDTLKSLGMPGAFDEPRGSADFSGMGPRKPDDYLYISNVFHKTFIEVDESGTEAAAATAVVMMRMTSAPVDPPVQFTVDRPFLFALMHRPTSTALFLGRVVSPAGQD